MRRSKNDSQVSGLNWKYRIAISEMERLPEEEIGVCV